MVEILFARNLRAITVGRIAVGVLPPSLLLLLTGTGSLPMVVAFTLLMGASQGIITIVRGAVPLALFGVKGYGAVLGAIATPVLVVNAASPTAFAWIVDRSGRGTARPSGAAGLRHALSASAKSPRRQQGDHPTDESRKAEARMVTAGHSRAEVP